MKIGPLKIKLKNQNNYFVSLRSLRYPSHSLQIGFPLYFGLPSVIFKVPGTSLQIQQSTMFNRQKMH